MRPSSNSHKPKVAYKFARVGSFCMALSMSKNEQDAQKKESIFLCYKSRIYALLGRLFGFPGASKLTIYERLLDKKVAAVVRCERGGLHRI